MHDKVDRQIFNSLQTLNSKISAIESRLEVIVNALFHVLLLEYKIMADLSVMESEVNDAATVMEGAVILIQGLRAELIAAGTDPVKLAELAAKLDTSTNALAVAVANVPTTPVDPSVPV